MIPTTGSATVPASAAGRPLIRSLGIVQATATALETVTAPISYLVTEQVNLLAEAASTAPGMAWATATETALRTDTGHLPVPATATALSTDTDHPPVLATDLDLMDVPSRNNETLPADQRVVFF